jgi:hypothetical protein
MEYNKTPSCGIVWTERGMIVTHYLPAKADVFAPGYVLQEPLMRRFDISQVFGRPRTDTILDVYCDVYKEVRGSATDITEARLGELKKTFEEKPTLPSESELREKGGKS